MAAVELNELASGFEFPEGPVYMPDGSIVLVEIAGRRVTRVSADGDKDVVAEPGGGPNGAAMGPDGKLWVCNNGAAFDYMEVEGMLIPSMPPPNHEGGRIERVDLESGEVERVYEECDGRPLIAPNDLVFDYEGDGFWFTDYGMRNERTIERGGVYWAKADGSEIREAIYPLENPNGIGLAPGGERVYVAETYSGRVWWWDVSAPGEVVEVPGLIEHGGQILAGLPGFQGFDSLAVDGEGYVCPATLVSGGVSAISPDGESVELFETGDILTTNVCFGGDDLRTAYVTLSATGRLASFEWPRAGLRLAHR